MNKRGKEVAALIIALCVYFGCIGLVNFLPEAQAQTQVSKEEEKQAKAEAKAQMKMEKKAQEAEALKQRKEAAERAKREKAELEKMKAQARAEEKAEAKRLAQEKAQAKSQPLESYLPEDHTPKMNVKQVNITGNILIDTNEIIAKMPMIYNTSVLPIEQADSSMLYDFRTISDIIHNPGPTRQVSARTIQGFSQFVLSLYQKRNYAGIYVFVPKSTMVGTNQLANDILVIEVLEAPITDVTVRIYDADQNEKEKGYLRKSALMGWSPVKEGQVANQKELDDFVNLLNRNPDRYVSATVTKGATDNSLAVQYDVYEANPWHYFVQIDNSGTRDRRWTPKVGVVNTNLLGYDDTFAAVFQAPWDKTIDENYALFGTYDIPIAGPKLRFQAYAGYAEFNINPDSGPFKFLGNGSFVGGVLRYNAYQTEENMPLLGGGWFVDVKGMVEYTRSKVTPNLFPNILRSNVRFWMWGWGIELHKKTDLTSTTIGFDRWESGKGQSNATAFNQARANSKSDFSIYDFSARHSQYIDTNKIHRVGGSGRWVMPNERLVPAKMTSFGGMYTVRGYDEYEIVADGGILASLQYEYDLIAADKAKNPPQDAEQAKQQEKENPFFIKRAAPLAFLDYGRTTIRGPRNVGESKHEELCSVGIGMLLDIGNNFSGAVYYGHPLIATPDTREGKGRLNCSFMMRW